MRKIRAGVVPVLLVIFFLGGINWWLSYARGGRYRDLLTAVYVAGLVKVQYYQPIKLGRLLETYLKTGSIPAMLKILNDPYTRFLPKQEYAELRRDTEGIFGGIGIYLVPKDTELLITSVLKDSPGSVAGLLQGDRIIAVDRVAVKKIGVNAAIAKIKGYPGTAVSLRILRGEGEHCKNLEFRITRANIHLPTVELEIRKDGRIGSYAFLKIMQFAGTTANDLEQKLNQLEKTPGCQAVVLDLRGNPGGELEAAIDVVGKFIPKGKPVLHIVRRGVPLDTVWNEKQSHRILPMVVLVDGWSASASEIVAGALKDQKRAVLVGTATFGKDLIQQIIELPGQEGISVTVASYLTSGKVNIHKKGVTPDWIVTIPGAADQMLKQGKTELYNKMRKMQEQKAVEVLQQQFVADNGKLLKAG